MKFALVFVAILAMRVSPWHAANNPFNLVHKMRLEDNQRHKIAAYEANTVDASRNEPNTIEEERCRWKSTWKV